MPQFLYEDLVIEYYREDIISHGGVIPRVKIRGRSKRDVSKKLSRKQRKLRRLDPVHIRLKEWLKANA